MSQRITGLPPFYGPDSRLLILGSFPSVLSRAQSFYYGNPRNRFWRVLADAAGAPEPVTVADKKALLTAGRIALWDVVQSCEIVGSMDKDIRAYEPADLYAVLCAAPVQKILLNGSTARQIFGRHFPELLPLSVSLPSTSPANVRFDEQPWRRALTETK